MSNHYHAVVDDARHQRHFGCALHAERTGPDLWPGSIGSFIRLCGSGASPAGTATEALSGVFGMIPPWSGALPAMHATHNARAETAGQRDSFRDAWHKVQHCIIPAEAIFEAYLRGFTSVPIRISLANGEPMGIAGLWSCQETSTGPLYSYTMLSINADGHALMGRLREPLYEKRMVVILPPERYQDWLQAPAQDSMGFMKPYPAQDLHALALDNVSPQP